MAWTAALSLSTWPSSIWPRSWACRQGYVREAPPNCLFRPIISICDRRGHPATSHPGRCACCSLRNLPGHEKRRCVLFLPLVGPFRDVCRIRPTVAGRRDAGRYHQPGLTLGRQWPHFFLKSDPGAADVRRSGLGNCQHRTYRPDLCKRCLRGIPGDCWCGYFEGLN